MMIKHCIHAWVIHPLYPRNVPFVSNHAKITIYARLGVAEEANTKLDRDLFVGGRLGKQGGDEITFWRTHKQGLGHPSLGEDLIVIQGRSPVEIYLRSREMET